ncbi:MAG: hypothetical protein KKF85_01915 [Gammaproteobacteria bacterium]|nr:hypothetical protein [Rhodocyclaceae bacterium]MBU3908581.1 hypothetical protein [Gammaproteobacteria bacterium]MBU3990472.1 hypothetical protein [Gammaproteobacteria bacterium]MBU4004609.1 hypothetical protein [Gammaproteobacteria bacterium]MBU4021212.1 hypothetical protein [Gammaproteobacteria bacterium]
MDITANVHTRPWQTLTEIFEVLKLRRDAYLNGCLPAEIDAIELLPASDAEGAKHARALANLGGESTRVTLSLDDATAERLSRVCAERNIPRNAFFDAFIWFLCVRLIEPALIIANPRTSLGLSREETEKTIRSVLGVDQFEIDGALDPDYYRQLIWTKERLKQERAHWEQIKRGARAEP